MTVLTRAGYVFIFLGAAYFLSCDKSELAQKNNPARIIEDQKPTKTIFKPINIISIQQEPQALSKITYLKAVSEIRSPFGAEEEHYFAKITDICSTQENEILVADSGHHKIFMFDDRGHFKKEFGRQGQGPGEFIGEVRISAGNDGNIYTTDNGGRRIIIFSPNGTFLRQFRIPHRFLEKAIATKKGNIILYCQNGYRIFSRYDNTFKPLDSLISLDYQADFPISRPSKKYYASILQGPDTSSNIRYCQRTMNYSLYSTIQKS